MFKRFTAISLLVIAVLSTPNLTAATLVRDTDPRETRPSLRRLVKIVKGFLGLPITQDDVLVPPKP
ncbi:MAG TPA: hypothetical protein VN181_03460 [Thermoanaerobaculia bacterium]|nr:hypothetical protein [Thermoanaerobaculia bacterium]